MTAATYLDGNVAPVATEVTATDLEVTGAAPPGLAGRYIRTGPNPCEMHVMSYGFDNPALRHHVIDPSGELTSTVEIDLPAPVMLHDMGLTASRVVLPPRTGTASDVLWIDVEPCFVYHPLNAFDVGDRVIIDAHDFGQPVATVHLPTRVPQGFHGSWIADSVLA